MKVYLRSAVAAAAALALGACVDNQPTAAPSAAPTSDPRADAPPAIPVMGPEVRILAFGDSLFAGYGLQSGESYPAKLEAALRARGVNARIAQAGVSGNTTSDGLARLAFTLENQPAPPQLVLLELGANDMLRALPPAQARANLDAILTELGKRKIPVVVMGMLAPPNLGGDYRQQFDTIYPDLARKHGATLVPFFLQAVMDRPDLVQQDRLHPTASGVEAIVAATVKQVADAAPKPDER